MSVIVISSDEDFETPQTKERKKKTPTKSVKSRTNSWPVKPLHVPSPSNPCKDLMPWLTTMKKRKYAHDQCRQATPTTSDEENNTVRNSAKHVKKKRTYQGTPTNSDDERINLLTVPIKDMYAKSKKRSPIKRAKLILDDISSTPSVETLIEPARNKVNCITSTGSLFDSAEDVRFNDDEKPSSQKRPQVVLKDIRFSEDKNFFGSFHAIFDSGKKQKPETSRPQNMAMPQGKKITSSKRLPCKVLKTTPASLSPKGQKMARDSDSDSSLELNRKRKNITPIAKFTESSDDEEEEETKSSHGRKSRSKSRSKSTSPHLEELLVENSEDYRDESPDWFVDSDDGLLPDESEEEDPYESNFLDDNDRDITFDDDPDETDNNTALPKSDQDCTTNVHVEKGNKTIKGETKNGNERNRTSRPRGAVKTTEAQNEEVSWPCRICTFLNHGAIPQCEICDASRYKKHKLDDEISTTNTTSEYQNDEMPSSSHARRSSGSKTEPDNCEPNETELEVHIVPTTHKDSVGSQYTEVDDLEAGYDQDDFLINLSQKIVVNLDSDEEIVLEDHERCTPTFIKFDGDVSETSSDTMILDETSDMIDRNDSMANDRTAANTSHGTNTFLVTADVNFKPKDSTSILRQRHDSLKYEGEAGSSSSEMDIMDSNATDLDESSLMNESTDDFDFHKKDVESSAKTIIAPRLKRQDLGSSDERLNQLIKIDKGRYKAQTHECEMLPMKRGRRSSVTTVTNELSTEESEIAVENLYVQDKPVQEKKERKRVSKVEHSPMKRSIKSAIQIMRTRKATVQRDDVTKSLHRQQPVPHSNESFHPTPPKTLPQGCEIPKVKPPNSAKLTIISRQHSLTKDMMKTIKPISKKTDAKKPTLTTYVNRPNLMSKSVPKPSTSTSSTTLPKEATKPFAVKHKDTVAPNTHNQNHVTLWNFFKYILKWNPHWLQEQDALRKRPPILDGHKTHRLVSTYKDFNDYYKVMLPPLLLEVWEIFSQAYRQSKESKTDKVSLLLAICGIEERSKKELLTFKCQALLPPSMSKSCFSDGDILDMDIVTSIQNGMPQISRSFGFVERVQYFPLKEQCLHPALACSSLVKQGNSTMIMLSVKMRHKYNINYHGLHQCKQLESLMTSVRQMSALCFLHKSPLCRDILRPSNTEVFVCHLDKAVPYAQFNDSQLKAIQQAKRAVFSQYALPKICLIQGPPGTGKSCTITGIIKQILKEGYKVERHMRLLVCAPSNAGIDELMKKILAERQQFERETGGKKLNCVRIGNPKYIHPDNIRMSLEQLVQRNMKMERHLLESGKQEVKTIENRIAKLKTKRRPSIEDEIRSLTIRRDKLISGVIKNKTTKETMKEEQQRKNHIIIKANVICATLSATGGPLLMNVYPPESKKKLKFDCIIIDEACQARELESLMPLQYGSTKLILVGDPEQLPATVLSKEAQALNFGQSLFERFYNHFRLRDEDETINPINLLTIQYRMHPKICRFPSQHFYRNKLVNDREVAKKRDRYPLQPYLIFDMVDSKEKDYGPGKIFNPLEADFVVDIINVIIKTSIKPESIGVIVPYQTQKAHTENKLSKRSLSQVEVNTVDGFQGREKDIIILSCVRAKAGGIGFLANKQRLNVALTRAKYSLFVVGHLKTLSTNSDWKELIEDGILRRIVKKTYHSNMEITAKECTKK